ncbi:MAG: FHA domain-containing protein [Synechococcaceae cyanobacterium SM2_3_1]|nr:FHA domain-containing protein [Synechococcaceae cyanobacterium SM2_3_1]
MFAITLEWVQGQVLQSQTINTAQSTLSPGVVRLGRDDQQCDIVVADPEGTVSRLHVEIYQDPRSQAVMLRNLTRARPEGKRNPAYVDGQRVVTEAVFLQAGQQVRLGKVQLTVRDLRLLGAPGSSPAETYGVVCPNGHLLSYDYLGLVCPHCGEAVQAGDTVSFHQKVDP